MRRHPCAQVDKNSRWGDLESEEEEEVSEEEEEEEPASEEEEVGLAALCAVHGMLGWPMLAARHLTQQQLASRSLHCRGCSRQWVWLRALAPWLLLLHVQRDPLHQVICAHQGQGSGVCGASWVISAERSGCLQAVAGDEAMADGLSSVASGYSSLPSGIETPDVLDLRKAKAAGACARSRPSPFKTVCSLHARLPGLPRAPQGQGREGSLASQAMHLALPCWAKTAQPMAKVGLPPWRCRRTSRHCARCWSRAPQARRRLSES